MRTESSSVVILKSEDLIGATEYFRLDAESLPHLMNVLSNLYSDPELAVVREYSTNAMDSHVAAGKPNLPIEVRLPTRLEPVFMVRDFGVGLSHKEVLEIYSSYGASTKRESNDFNGQLGLGCKAAFTYTGHFSLTAIKDGEKNFYSLHLGEEGVPVVTRLHSESTEEGNGVTVEVPVKDVAKFNSVAKEFYKWFSPLPLFKGYVQDIPINPTPAQVFDRFELYQDSVLPSDSVLMGNVLYPIAPEFLPSINRMYNLKLLIRANIGEVTFTPNRESLMYTKKTKSFLEKSLAAYNEEVLGWAKKELEEANKKGILQTALRYYFLRSNACQWLPDAMVLSDGTEVGHRAFERAGLLGQLPSFIRIRMERTRTSTLKPISRQVSTFNVSTEYGGIVYFLRLPAELNSESEKLKKALSRFISANHYQNWSKVSFFVLPKSENWEFEDSAFKEFQVLDAGELIKNYYARSSGTRNRTSRTAVEAYVVSFRGGVKKWELSPVRLQFIQQLDNFYWVPLEGKIVAPNEGYDFSLLSAVVPLLTHVSGKDMTLVGVRKSSLDQIKSFNNGLYLTDWLSSEGYALCQRLAIDAAAMDVFSPNGYYRTTGEPLDAVHKLFCLDLDPNELRFDQELRSFYTEYRPVVQKLSPINSHYFFHGLSLLQNFVVGIFRKKMGEEYANLKLEELREIEKSHKETLQKKVEYIGGKYPMLKHLNTKLSDSNIVLDVLEYLYLVNKHKSSYPRKREAAR